MNEPIRKVLPETYAAMAELHVKIEKQIAFLNEKRALSRDETLASELAILIEEGEQLRDKMEHDMRLLKPTEQ